MYRIELTPEEFRSACYMDDRGYLGGIVTHCTNEEHDDSGNVVLTFTESDAWKVLAQCEDDPDAVWALTTPSTSLGQKFQRFLNSIV